MFVLIEGSWPFMTFNLAEMTTKTSFVWTYFSTTANKSEVACDVCKTNGRETKIKRTGNSTTSMASHLRTQHQIADPSKDDQTAFEVKRKGMQLQSNSSVRKYFKSDTTLAGYLSIFNVQPFKFGIF